MTKKIFNYGAWGIGAVLFIAFFCPVTAFASTNISATTTNHWAWNDFIGWINFYSTGNVMVTSSTVTGDASSSASIISLDCGTHGLCGSHSYGVSNNSAGYISGWAWNDTYGWISFWCGNGGTGCGVSNYRVTIDPGGNFQGYAWNDIIGWISFNCDNPGGPGCGGSNYETQVQPSSWVVTSTIGSVDSQTFDTGVPGGAQLNSVLWWGFMPTGASSTGAAVGFQFAASNSSSGPWSFIGPNGDTGLYWNASSSGVSVPLDYILYNNYRYFRYRVTLFSNTAQTMSPRVDDVIVNWSP
jgi:hypothetical protein